MHIVCVKNYNNECATAEGMKEKNKHPALYASCDEQINPLKQMFIDMTLLYESFYKTSAFFGHKVQVQKLISCFFFIWWEWCIDPSTVFSYFQLY